MPVLAQLILYPVKSCAGIVLQKATLTRAGLAHAGVHDREWMLVDPSGLFISQRECPALACVQPQLQGAGLVLQAPGMPPLELPLAAGQPRRMAQVWDDQLAAEDSGELAADWFSAYLGRPCRLVRCPADVRRQASASWTGGRDAPTLFGDGFPLLIAGSASLADLNARLQAAGRAALPMDRFRPNLVFDAIAAFEEDYLAGLRHADTAIVPVKPCARCTIPAVDQGSGLPGPDPLDILQTYRRQPILDDAVCFGMNALVSGAAPVQIFAGQAWQAELNFD